MKQILSICLFILMLGVAVAQQSTNNSPIATNNAVVTVEDIKSKAEQGDANAQFFLGAYYFATNDTEAVKWFQKSANQGNVLAQSFLAVCYENGKGVSKDMVEAVKWYRKVAEQGGVYAQYRVGYAYQVGNGVVQDYTEAAKWYRRAAEQGDVGAQSSLGLFYEDGTGVPKSNVEAYKWFNLAASQTGNDENEKKFIQNSATLRDSMVKLGKITPEEIAEAQQLSAAFVPKKETLSSSSDNSIASNNPRFSGTGFFITDDGYLISNYHVVKDATKVRLLTGLRRDEVASATQAGAGLIDAKVVQVDEANDLALLKADGKFSPLPISSSRSAQLGGTVATVGVAGVRAQGAGARPPRGKSHRCPARGDDPRYFQISAVFADGHHTAGQFGRGAGG
jgi:Trypsin-like peptidase domain/Sel1 repeat